MTADTLRRAAEMGFAVSTGQLPAELANAVSDAFNAALRRGMAVDEAASVVVSVAADYARAEYGGSYLKGLARVVRDRRHEPLPKDIGGR